ncbi:MAG TPA: hypothetical protein VN428_25710 [Bryobacteraceae bacterium]|nr:hypothetical protein [Bryobacteraceae bacterium]
MPVFKIHRLKDSAQQQFRWAPHTSGASPVKPKDYESAGEVEATTPYEAWLSLKGSEQALRVGDLLESETGSLRVCKYVGFEEAAWVIPEQKPAPEPAAASPQSS